MLTKILETQRNHPTLEKVNGGPIIDCYITPLHRETKHRETKHRETKHRETRMRLIII